MKTQVFEGWFRGAEAVSTMGDVAELDALLAFNASVEVASCTMCGG